MAMPPYVLSARMRTATTRNHGSNFCLGNWHPSWSKEDPSSTENLKYSAIDWCRDMGLAAKLSFRPATLWASNGIYHVVINWLCCQNVSGPPKYEFDKENWLYEEERGYVDHNIVSFPPWLNPWYLCAGKDLDNRPGDIYLQFGIILSHLYSCVGVMSFHQYISHRGVRESEWSYFREWVVTQNRCFGEWLYTLYRCTMPASSSISAWHKCMRLHMLSIRYNVFHLWVFLTGLRQ